jgi:hypothetical protein
MVLGTKNHFAGRVKQQLAVSQSLLNNLQINTDIIHSVMSLILIFIMMRTSNITPRWLYDPNYYIYSEVTHLLLVELSNMCDRLECWLKE